MNSDPVFLRMNTLVEERRIMHKDLIAYLGMAKGTYTQWKKGACLSYKSHLAEISKFFNVSISYLAEGIQNEDGSSFSEINMLSSHEKDLILMFRETTSEIQNSILQLLRSIVQDTE